MAMTKVMNAVATLGKYTNAQGEEKKRYMTIGSLFRRDDDSLVLKLDAVPVGEDFSGWVNFYEPQERSDTPAKQAPAPSQDETSANLDDDIPFD